MTCASSGKTSVFPDGVTGYPVTALPGYPQILFFIFPLPHCSSWGKCLALVWTEQFQDLPCIHMANLHVDTIDIMAMAINVVKP